MMDDSTPPHNDECNDGQSDEGGAVEFYIPEDFNFPTAENSTCVLRHNKGWFQLQHNQPPHGVLDQFRCSDVVGVTVEVQYTDGYGSVVPTVKPSDQRHNGEEQEVGFSLPPPSEFSTMPECAPVSLAEYLEEQHNYHWDQACGDLPLDSQGVAFLTIHVYEPTLQFQREDNEAYHWPASLFRYPCFLLTDTQPKPPLPQPRQYFNLSNHPPKRYANPRKLQVLPQQHLGMLGLKLVPSLIHRAGLASSFSEKRQGQRRRQRRHLVIVDDHPLALSVCKETLQPMLEQEAGIELVIKFALVDQELWLQHTPLVDDEHYEAILLVCRGGKDDSFVHRVLNILYQREDHAAVWDELTLGIIVSDPATLRLAATLLWECPSVSEDMKYAKASPTDVAFSIARGNTFSRHFAKFSTRSGSEYISYSSFAWAMTGEAAQNSMITDLYGLSLYCTACFQSYRATLYHGSKSDADNTMQVPRLTEPVPSDWTVVEGDFLLFWTTHYHGFFLIHFARASPDFGRWELAQSILSGGSSERLETVECTAYRLEPSKTSKCPNVLDGVVLPELGPIQGEMLPRAMKMYGEGHDETGSS